MKSLKSTLESFKENELSKMHKLNVYGGLTDAGGDTSDELTLEPEFDENGNPQSAGPKGGSSSTQSAATGSSLGNSTTGSTPPKIG